MQVGVAYPIGGPGLGLGSICNKILFVQKSSKYPIRYDIFIGKGDVICVGGDPNFLFMVSDLGKKESKIILGTDNESKLNQFISFDEKVVEFTGSSYKFSLSLTGLEMIGKLRAKISLLSKNKKK